MYKRQDQNNEDTFVKEYHVAEKIEDENPEVIEDEIDYDESFKYVESLDEDEEELGVYENKDNNKDYTIIADMPKYDDGDLDV